MKKRILRVMSIIVILLLSMGSVIFAGTMTVPGTDFTKSFNHKYTIGSTLTYKVGGLFGNGYNETKQEITSAESSYVSAQFTSLNGVQSPEIYNADGGFFGYVYSGKSYGETKYAKRLMFYSDVRRNDIIVDDIKVYYE